MCALICCVAKVKSVIELERVFQQTSVACAKRSIHDTEFVFTWDSTRIVHAEVEPLLYRRIHKRVATCFIVNTQRTGHVHSSSSSLPLLLITLSPYVLQSAVCILFTPKTFYILQYIGGRS